MLNAVMARKFDRPETDTLGQIAGRALSVCPLFDLPGGLPLIGDISPDCPPDYLAGRQTANDRDGLKLCQRVATIC